MCLVLGATAGPFVRRESGKSKKVCSAQWTFATLHGRAAAAASRQRIQQGADGDRSLGAPACFAPFVDTLLLH